MQFTDAERNDILAGCNQFLTYRHEGSLADKLLQMAESEYAQMGQDHYGKGGFVAAFEAEIAALLGKEAAVFMPSGTMAQQIALRIWCDRADCRTVAFHPTCHMEIHEQMAYRELHHLTAILLGEKDRLFTLKDLMGLNGQIAALLIELPQREIGGQLPTWDELVDLCDWAHERGVMTHMDGARLWECKPFYNRPYAEIAALFDTVYVSFYKILRGLPGAVLAGSTDLIAEARIWLRRHGGNLYTLAPNAIAAKIGLETHLPRIGEYCAKASEIAGALAGIKGLRVVPEKPPTNMMHLFFTGDKERLEDGFWSAAKESRMMMCRGLVPTGSPDIWKMEVTVSNTSLALDVTEMRRLMTQVISLA